MIHSSYSAPQHPRSPQMGGSYSRGITHHKRNCSQFWSMEGQWICNETANWYEGFIPGYPSTNNELGRANMALKDDYTQHFKWGKA